ncbi:28S ribosomal protein S15, mitochondrial [Silurus meridionalis]|uniref:28S ribosomal protein S15, mitochondrial n=1 Tax=Silurus meridionalis TaxID=175797 RepID=UPI001EEA8A4C|nr:28S ribosomal protein S15, mitochondrial [Silurus meridionalis]
MFLKHSLKSTAAAGRVWSVLSGARHGGVPAVAARQPVYCSAIPQRCAPFTCMTTRGNEPLKIQPVRQYARAVQKKPEFQSQLQDLPSSVLKLEYASVPLAHAVDGVVKKLLSLELASHSERLRLKQEQLIAKVQRHENDRNSTEVGVAVLTARIRNFQEHLQKHPKDKANKRWMLMSIDRRKKLLKYLRSSRYDAFEKVCTELGITYTFPPEYYRRATRRWLAKKALCIKVFKEVQKQKEEKRHALDQKKAKSASSSSTETEGTPV